MERKTAKDFDQDLLNLFDQYVHGAIDRRGFLERAAKYASAGVTAAVLLDQLNPQFVAAQQVPKDDNPEQDIEADPNKPPEERGNFVRVSGL